jgi:metal-responsive CopG/Arc/MetJ family transcriptional regulator
MTETVSFKVSRTLLLKIDGAAANRSDFIRDAINEKLERFRKRNKSAWDALNGVGALDLRIPNAPGRVKRIRL